MIAKSLFLAAGETLHELQTEFLDFGLILQERLQLLLLGLGQNLAGPCENARLQFFLLRDLFLHHFAGRHAVSHGLLLLLHGGSERQFLPLQPVQTDLESDLRRVPYPEPVWNDNLFGQSGQGQ